MNPRVDYDRIADRYDDEPLRAKPVDPDLLAFLGEDGAPEPSALAVLDVGCGTGNQLVADAAPFPGALLVGADPFMGMLREGRRKSGKVHWIRSVGSRLPFMDGSFHFVTMQFALHHVQDKAALAGEVFRILETGGRFAMINISPHDMREWAIYRYFPAAWARDASDFLPHEGIVRLLEAAGFGSIVSEKISCPSEQDLRDFARTVRERTISQFLTITEEEYRAGLARIEEEIRLAGDEPLPFVNPCCLSKIRGDR
jgi:ubiquinone/menaquinone biosynthesis C-methylase UbiE